MKGIIGTKGSQTTVGELSKFGSQQINLSLLQSNLRQYFDLIQSELYASESLKPLALKTSSR